MNTEQIQKLDDLAFRPLQDANICVGGPYTGRGNEEKDARIWLQFIGASQVGNDDQPFGEPVRLAIALTPAQYAEVVKRFFWEVTVSNGLMANFLRRLLRKRWAVMTKEMAKREDFVEIHLPRYS